MVQHTLYPTPEQYITVGTKLVMKYSNLQDPVGNRIVSAYSHLGHYQSFTLTNKGSWKISLQNTFKIYRKDHKTTPPLSEQPHDDPPEKRARVEKVSATVCSVWDLQLICCVM